jgi:hypothetical protein
MRFLVFFLGFLGTLNLAGLGLLWLGAYFSRDVVAEARAAGLELVLPYAIDLMTIKTALFLLVGAGMSFLGLLFVLLRRGWQSAILMLLAALGPALLSPEVLMTGGLLILAGMCALCVRPLPVMEPA